MLVALVYGSALVLAFVLLYFFHTRWYWHALSVVAALALGFVPPDIVPIPAGVTRDLAVGFLFLLLIVWGLGAPLFYKHHEMHAPPHH